MASLLACVQRSGSTAKTPWAEDTAKLVWLREFCLFREVNFSTEVELNRAINAPATGNTFDAYLAASKASTPAPNAVRVFRHIYSLQES